MAPNLINKIFHCKGLGSRIFQTWYQAGKINVRNFTPESTLRNVVEENPKQSVDKGVVVKNDEIYVIFSDKKVMKFSSGKLAKFSDGCALVTFENTTVMATSVAKPKLGDESFLPLIVSYRQKAAALGRIPLNFLRRDLGQSDTEILTSRVIDRSLRPLFPPGFNWEVQVICNPLAIDGNNFPDVLSINAASAALAVSDIPWDGPVGAVRIGLIDGEPVINPSKMELKNSNLNMIISSRSNKLIVMLEGCGSNILLPDLLKVAKVGVKECQVVIQGINKLKELHGKEKREFELPKTNSELVEAIRNHSADKLREIFQNKSHHKLSRDKEVSDLKNVVIESVKEHFSSDDMKMADEIFHSICKAEFRKQILDEDVRCDGRSLSDIREIKCEVGLYNPLHGSALFQRGQTQVMCTVALDSPGSALKMDKIAMISSGLKEKNFFVHYEFPPFATKEIGKVGPIGRREIGHGALAEKALKAVVPEEFPLTIRLTSEVLESNGSSSMATVCGGSLALLDAGVPLSSPCAGVAMGLISTFSEQNPLEMSNYKILTDLLGIEDHFGDMDFKLAGTKKFITAFQMDIKIPGISVKLLSEILTQGKAAILNILKTMNSVCEEPRIKKKENWPSTQKVNVPIHLRSKFLGPGGVNLKKLEMNVGVEILEESPGEFVIFAANNDAMEEASEIIKNILEMTAEPVLEFGDVYTATITEIRENGCMVTLFPNMQPVFIHVSQLDHKKVSHPSVLGMEVGEQIKVKYFGRDPVSGMMRLSRKVLQGISTHTPQHTLIKESPRSDHSSGES